MPQEPLKICLVSSELTPLAKTGGLADVASALSDYLERQGHDIRVLVPFYSSIDSSTMSITPVQFMQNLSIKIGIHEFLYSVDTATLPGTELSIYLLRCPLLYDRESIYTSDSDEHLRFILLSRVAIEMCQHMGFSPDIFHCNDWHTSLVPLYLKTRYAWDGLFRNTRSVLTIHNIGYQGVFSSDILPDLGLQHEADKLHQDDISNGMINFLKTGLLYADVLTTVSPSYAREILHPEYGMGLEDILNERRGSLVGILNGVDYNDWNPEADPLIPYAYGSRRIAGKKKNKLALMKELGLDCSDDMPLIGMVTRLAGQKGLDLVEQVIPEMMMQRRFAMAILGSGDPHYEHFFSWLQQRYPDRVCFYCGFNNKLAHHIEAGSDMFLMPSRFEPCGLNQMYSLRYGTVPIVRRTGGLGDSVQQFDPSSGEGTGVVFNDYDASALGWAINFALDLYPEKPVWRKLMRNGMAMDYSWEHQGQYYVDLFYRLTGK